MYIYLKSLQYFALLGLLGPTKNHEITLKNQGGRAGITEKRDLRGVTTDLLDV